MRKIDQLFERYGESHCNPRNKAIHWICVPLIVWSVLAALWAWSPVAAYVGIGLAVAYYAWLSPVIAVGMLAIVAVPSNPFEMPSTVIFILLSNGIAFVSSRTSVIALLAISFVKTVLSVPETIRSI